jgi:hypothetical protein
MSMAETGSGPGARCSTKTSNTAKTWLKWCQPTSNKLIKIDNQDHCNLFQTAKPTAVTKSTNRKVKQMEHKKKSIQASARKRKKNLFILMNGHRTTSQASIAVV